MEIEITEVQVQRLNLQPGELLLVRVPGEGTAQGFDAVRRSFMRGLATAGFDNQVLVCPADFDVSVVAGANKGHGHVWPRPDGAKARCGGPGICSECSRDAAMKLAGA